MAEALEREPDPGTRLGATLLFLRTMTLTPEALGPDDARAVFAAGVSREALDDAIHIAVLFNTINRVADALGFDIPSDEAFAASARLILRFGYLV